MKKSLPIILILLLLIGGGSFLAFQKNKTTPLDSNNKLVQDQTKTGGVFDSIQDALTKSLSLECTYQDENGTQTTTYIKGGTIRVDAKSASQGQTNYSQVIFKDRKMYSWDPVSKQGMVLEIPDVTPQVESSPDKASSDNREEDLLTAIEKYKNSCKNASVSDSLFIPPEDVTFEDFSQMMQKSESTMPNDETLPSFDLEDLKKKFAPDNQ